MLRQTVALAGLFVLLAAGAHAGDLEGKVLKVGTDATYPPMETVDEATGEIVGFDVDMLNAVCERINCVPQFVNTAWDGIFAALQQVSSTWSCRACRSPPSATKPWTSRSPTWS